MLFFLKSSRGEGGGGKKRRGGGEEEGEVGGLYNERIRDGPGGVGDVRQLSELINTACFAQRNSLKFGWLRREGLGSDRTESESYKPCGTLGQRILLRPGVTIGIAVAERRLVRSVMGRRRGLAVSQHSTKVGIQIEYMICA